MRILQLICLLLPLSAHAQERSIRIYAASSLSNVLQDISKVYKTKSKIIFNFDASSKLAKQIESGAPADIYFSADSEWMDYLENKHLIIPESRNNFLSNKIVLIIPEDMKQKPNSPEILLTDSIHHIALASESVPAGKYARSALKSLGLYTDRLQKKIVNADNVRIAMTWVSNHEASAGMVYATDAKVEPKVKIIYEFSDQTHPKIIYPAAILKGSPSASESKKLLEFLKSRQAKEIFKKAGFITL